MAGAGWGWACDLGWAVVELGWTGLGGWRALVSGQGGCWTRRPVGLEGWAGVRGRRGLVWAGVAGWALGLAGAAGLCVRLG